MVRFIKKVIPLSLGITCFLSIASFCNETQVYADTNSNIGWRNDNGHWYYYKADSSSAFGWLEIDGKYYYFDDNGIMKTGWIHKNDCSYYLDDSGALSKGWVKISDSWYYFDDNGIMQKGWLELNNVKYHLDDKGRMSTGLFKDNGHTYYLDENGVMKTGWQKKDDDWYYFNEDGTMAKGFINDNDTLYYITDDGKLSQKSGWTNIDHKDYYLEDGTVKTGWLYDGDKTYYLIKDGSIGKSWQLIDNKYYYFKDDGTMFKGDWLNLNNTWYYIDDDGVMKSSSWLQYKDNWYYFNQDGSMAKDMSIDDWNIDSNGIATPGKRNISDAGVKFIADYEGFSSTPYVGQDAQNTTIGYGHVIQPGENLTYLTQDEGRELMKQDLQVYVDGVNKNTDGLNLTSNQFDALVSFTYNCGIQAFANSSLLRDIKNNESSETIKADFLKYSHTTDASGNLIESLGLWRRRLDEWEMYDHADYQRDYKNPD